MRTAEEIKSEINKLTSDIDWHNMADRLTPAEKEERRELERKRDELYQKLQEVTHE